VSERPDVRSLVPPGDVLLVTLDALRYDVAQDAHERGETPQLSRLLPAAGWTRCHAPGSFTYPSHQAMFAGFLPTPSRRHRQPRLFCMTGTMPHSIDERTLVLDAPDLVSGLRGLGYHTACIGGVAFFDGKTHLGRVLPALFDESHWAPEMAVTAVDSTRSQVERARAIVERQPATSPLFLFMNVSALHPPTHAYLDGARRDSVETQRAALAYVDSQLPPLLAILQERAARRRAPALAILCSDHGTTFGDDGYVGHRLAHPAVWDVPYLETVLG
jgi:hypothetical protein